MRSALVLAFSLAAVGCGKSELSLPIAAEPSADAGVDASDASLDAPVANDASDANDAGPTIADCLDGGLVQHAPSTKRLRDVVGIASNPGDFPLGNDAESIAKRKGYFDAANDLGIALIRRDFEWDQIEPSRGAFVWDGYDQLVAEAAQRNVRLLGTLDYGTTWASAKAKDIYYPPDDPNDFGAFAAAVAGRYAGKIAGWEIWNEPNNGWRFWKETLSGDPAGYATLLATAHDAARGADPTTPVLLGGTVFTPQVIDGAMTFLSAAYMARPDLASKFEIAGVHTYMKYPPTKPPEASSADDLSLVEKLEAHTCLLAANGAADKPIWITELGWPTYPPVDEAAQARFSVRAALLAASAGADAVFFYTLRDGPKPDAFPPEDAFGLLHNDGDFAHGKESTPKKAYAALKAMIAVAGDAAPDADNPGSGDPSSDVRAVRLVRSDGRRILAAWTVTAASGSIAAPFDADAFDQSGTEIGSVASGAPAAIGPDVTYLVAK